VAAIGTTAVVRMHATAQMAGEAEIESATAAFPVAAVLAIPAPLAEAVAPVEAVHAAAALAVHPV
jgi:hypothetical protein